MFDFKWEKRASICSEEIRGLRVQLNVLRFCTLILPVTGHHSYTDTHTHTHMYVCVYIYIYTPTYASYTPVLKWNTII